jgi:hypothetical protein
MLPLMVGRPSPPQSLFPLRMDIFGSSASYILNTSVVYGPLPLDAFGSHPNENRVLHKTG